MFEINCPFIHSFNVRMHLQRTANLDEWTRLDLCETSGCTLTTARGFANYTALCSLTRRWTATTPNTLQPPSAMEVMLDTFGSNESKTTADKQTTDFSCVTALMKSWPLCASTSPQPPWCVYTTDGKPEPWDSRGIRVQFQGRKLHEYKQRQSQKKPGWGFSLLHFRFKQKRHALSLTFILTSFYTVDTYWIH